MAIANKVTKQNRLPKSKEGRIPVLAQQFNKLVDTVNEVKVSVDSLEIPEVNYTLYEAIVFQGELEEFEPPTATEVFNNTGATFSWSRAIAGGFGAGKSNIESSSSIFVEGEFIVQTQMINSANLGRTTSISIVDDDNLLLDVGNSSGTNTDSWKLFIQIKFIIN